VIVETEQGLGFGTVIVEPEYREDASPEKPLKKVFRLATQEDFEQLAQNTELEKSAFEFCLKSIQELGLSMNLFAVESTFDQNKLTFFFTAEGRIDFRQLVKILVKELGARIEMRQVGIRNQAKDVRRRRPVRPPAVLFAVHGKIRSGIHSNGQGAGLILESHKDFRTMRTADVLSDV